MNIYKKYEKFIAIVAVALFVLSLVPILYLTFINRASGDDYSYGAYTRNAWIGARTLGLIPSIGALFTAIGQTIRQYYIGWQGTWFSIILFALQPEVFSDQAYFIVAPIMLLLWIGSTCYLGKEVIGRRFGYSRWNTCLQLIIILFISIQLVPSTKSSIFWWNGCVHYLVPFAMCQMTLAWILKYIDTFSFKYLTMISIFMALLGGSSYQPALFVLIVAGYAVIYGICRNRLFSIKTTKDVKDQEYTCGSGANIKGYLLLIIPIVLELIGLVISAVAPGNKVRGGEEFGFTIGKAFGTIVLSFAYGLRDMWTYVKERPLLYIGLVVYIAVVLLGQTTRCVDCDADNNADNNADIDSNCIDKNDKLMTRVSLNTGWKIVLVLASFCLYSAMQSPAIFANVDVSRGVLNFNFQCFVLLMVVVVLTVCPLLYNVYTGREHQKLLSNMQAGKKQPGLFSNNISNSSASCQKIYKFVGIVVFLIALFFARHNIKTTTDWVCLEYIITGQASDYKYQMDLQTRLLESDEKDVVLPLINEFQGPLMHMPVIEDKEAWTNRTVAEFYHKNSTLGMEREEWEKIQSLE